MFQSQPLGITFRTSLSVALIAMVQLANAATRLVTSPADNNSPDTLRGVISNSVSGDTITFAPYLSGATILLTGGRIILSNSLAIDASTLPAGVIIDGNTNGRIFQVFSNTTVTLDSLTITNGKTTVGGGIANQGTLTLNKCTVTGNSSSFGGGIYNVGTLTLSNCTLAGNISAMDGGGIYDDGVLNINQSTLYGNIATEWGGAVYGIGSEVTLNQCTVSGNDAQSGGGLYISSVLTLKHCTVSANHANQGGGVLLLAPMEPWSLVNSIIAGNTSSDNTNFRIIIGFSPLPPILAGINITSGNPLLAPLGNYGGPTLTMPPLPSSPAIDASTDGTTFTTDQRGFPRPIDGNGDSIAVADLGAVEGFVYYGPGVLSGMKKLGNGSMQFGFSNNTNQSFTVFASPDLAASLNTWTPIGSAAETPSGSGQYQFTDPNATNNSQRFYRVRSP